jgi:predicted nucleic acid-binding Zn finger protein
MATARRTGEARREAGAPQTCNLVLRIADRRYAVRGGPALSVGARTRSFRLRCLDGGAVYFVEETAFGPECTCPDFTYRHGELDGSACKHIRALAAVGILAGFHGRTDHDD